MASIRHDEKLVTFKIVYCGTPLCGKTTNLRLIHEKLDPSGRTDLVSMSTAADRTLFFDFLSVEAAAIPGYRTSFHLYTVPGQITYNATLQLVLRQADGVVFVADSQMDRQRDNIQAFQNLDANLRLNGSSLETLPIVLQYNKRDLPNAAPVEYMEFLLNNRPERFLSFEAEAQNGRNVLATLNAISQNVLARFQSQVNALQNPAPDRLGTSATAADPAALPA
jgi:mutual gliding-motility protein MglA